MQNLRVFIASPGDVSEEREIVSFVIDELHRSLCEALNINLQAIRWETHAWPDVGEDAQDVINKEIGEFDLFIGMMWKHFGTPTNRSELGTEEEFIRAYKLFEKYGRPKIMFYFKTAPFFSKDINEISQFKKVIEFRKKLEKLGVLFWEFSDTLQFERRVREHLTRQLLRLSLQSKTQPLTKPINVPKIFLCYAREDLDKVEHIYNALKSAGFEPWLDVKDIRPGDRWKLVLDKVIRESDLFVACISNISATKKGFVQKELKIGLDILNEHPNSDIYIIPVKLEPCSIPQELANIQFINFFDENGTEHLISAIGNAWEKHLKTNILKKQHDIQFLKDFKQSEGLDISEELNQLLIYLFENTNDSQRHTDAIAQALKIKYEKAKYFIDKLIKYNFVRQTHLNYVKGRVYFGLTEKGREYVVKNGLTG